MSVLQHVRSSHKKILPVFWVQDISSSFTKAHYIEALNDSMRDTIDTLTIVGREQPDCDIFMAHLMVHEIAEWRWVGLRYIENVFWDDLVPKNTSFNLDAALSELQIAMTYGAFFDKSNVIIVR